MSESHAFLPNGHPNEEELFLFVELELPRLKANCVREHVQGCWDCRARLEAIEEAMSSYVSYKHQVLEQAVPAPPAGWLRFPGQLREALRRAPQRSFRDRVRALIHESAIIGRLLQPGAITTVVVLVSLLVWFLFLNRVPVLSAKEALLNAQNSQSAELERTSKPVVHQRVRVTSGTRRAEGEIWHAARSRRFRDQWTGERRIVQELGSAYQAHGLDFEEPLSASNFSEWRDSLRAAEDRVTRDASGQYVRISTTSGNNGAGGPILAADITLRKTDWHPVEQTLRIRTVEGTVADYHLQEISFEVLPLDRVSDVFGEPSKEFEAEGTLPSVPRTLVPLSPRVPSETELEEAEAQLREAMHKLGADVQEAPEIWRDGSRVLFRLWTDSQERRTAIEQATAGIPHVQEAGPEQTAPRVPDAVQPSKALHTATPPLAKVLEEQLGGLDAANNLLDNVRDDYLRVLAQASALERLGRRYPAVDLAGLPVDARNRIVQIATDYADVIHGGTDAYLKLLSPVLDGMLAKTGMTAQETGIAACGSWQQASTKVVEDLRRLEKAFNRLFVRDQSEEQASLSAEAWLSESAQARAALQEDLGMLCRPQ